MLKDLSFKGLVIGSMMAAFLLGNHAIAQRQCIPASQCCRICTKGKACGNSCIHATFMCHKGRGCACDDYEVCP